MTCLVTGIGLISALGNNSYQSWHRLLAGETGITRSPVFPARPLALVNPPSLGSPQDLLDRALEMAVADAGWQLPLEECGVAIASSRGYQSQWERWAVGGEGERGRGGEGEQGQQGENFTALNWLDTLPHMLSVKVAHRVGATGPVSSPMSACTTGLWAIALGCEWIETGQCQRAIVGATESCITALNLAGFDRLGALATTGAYPFDRQRQGLVLGEGAAVLLLEADPSSSRKSYGRVLGFAFGNDAYHPTAPAADNLVAANTVRLCLQRSYLVPQEISYIHAHGTGTRLNDEREARLVEALFPQGVPISSTKGATGHTLGASGAIGAAFCLLALQQQILPPCVGLQDPEFDLDFVLKARDRWLETALCLGFGFGGQNAALAFSR
ncbi:MAG: beta-ketoacyl-ACP synthase [Cyanosarcina radialis HA8281-LM2]|nr:beta-ketoacyl-ACP synthase [Cyanosarcina radialis HA8281-LM2]